MTKEIYSFVELCAAARAVAEEVHVALQTWESAKPLLFPGTIGGLVGDDPNSENPEYDPLRSIGRGASIAAILALARIWDRTRSAKLKLDCFPDSLRCETCLRQLVATAALAERDVLKHIAALEKIVARTGDFGRALHALATWRNKRLAHREPGWTRPIQDRVRYADLELIMERSIDLVERLVLLLPDAFRKAATISEPRKSQDEWNQRSRSLWTRVARGLEALPQDLNGFLAGSGPSMETD